MTQQPPPFIPYSDLANDPNPACVPVISIIGICLGGLTVLGRLGLMFIGIVLTSISQNAGTNVGYSFSSLAWGLMYAAFGGWLLIAALGCLKRKEWARQALVAYAFVYPIALLGDIIATALAAGPMVSTSISSTSTTRTVMPMPSSGIMMTAVITEVFISLMFMVYPTCVLIFMRSPRVRAVFV